MADILYQLPEKIWFDSEGAEQDVVFSSRARLSRNLAGFAFPGKLDNSGRLDVMDKIIRAFSGLNASTGISVSYLKDLGKLDKQLLLERNLISQDYSLDPANPIITDPTECFSAVVHEIDHLRLSWIVPGLDLPEALSRAAATDQMLEKELSFAVSMEWGYLTSEWFNTGTGLKLSVLFHLPALCRTSMIEKAIRTVASLGLEIRGYTSDDGPSLGDLYQVSHQLGFGQTEEEAAYLLHDVSLRVIQLERAARAQLLDKGGAGISDRIGRSFGILRYGRLISAAEATSCLSDVRLGICLTLIKGVHLKEVTRLFFLIQRFHVQALLAGRLLSADDRQVEAYRSGLIRKTLQCATFEEVADV